MQKALKGEVKKDKKMMAEQKENANKEIGNLKINQKEILELKSTIIEMKNSLKGFKGRFQLQIEQWKYWVWEKERKKNWRKKKQSQWDLWDTIKGTKICIVEVPKEEREKRAERISDETIVENSPNLMKDMK